MVMLRYAYTVEMVFRLPCPESPERTGSDNVYIGSAGEPGESGVIRIGNPNTDTRTILVGEVEGDIKVVPVYQ